MKNKQNTFTIRIEEKGEFPQNWPEWKAGGVDFLEVPENISVIDIEEGMLIWEFKNDIPQLGKIISAKIGNLTDKKPILDEWLKNTERCLQIDIPFEKINDITGNIENKEENIGFFISKYGCKQVKLLISLEKWSDLVFLEMPFKENISFGIKILGPIIREELPGALILLGDWCLKNLVNNVTLTLPSSLDNPVLYIRNCSAAWRSLSLKLHGVHLVSCPTCSRCHTDLRPLAHEVAEALVNITVPLEVAVMGCEVNGPGEAKAADVGIAFGDGVALLFEKGEVKKRVPTDQAVPELLKTVNHLVENYKQ